MITYSHRIPHLAQNLKKLFLVMVSLYPPSNLEILTLTTQLVGDAFVRELEVSKITLRLVEKTDTKGEEDSDHSLAKLTGPTLPTLQQCLVRIPLLVNLLETLEIC